MTEITDEQILEACDRPFECYDFDQPITVRIWFKQVLMRLIEEQDRFSGKRPFGNGGWIGYLGVPFVQAGFIDGDEEGYPNDRDAVENLLLRAIHLLLASKAQ
jgi:hypothetical protein